MYYINKRIIHFNVFIYFQYRIRVSMMTFKSTNIFTFASESHILFFCSHTIAKYNFTYQYIIYCLLQTFI